MIAPAARDDRRPALPGRGAGGGNLGRHTPRTDSFVARSAGHRGDSLVDARDVGDVARGGDITYVCVEYPQTPNSKPSGKPRTRLSNRFLKRKRFLRKTLN